MYLRLLIFTKQKKKEGVCVCELMDQMGIDLFAIQLWKLTLIYKSKLFYHFCMLWRRKQEEGGDVGGKVGSWLLDCGVEWWFHFNYFDVTLYLLKV